MSTNLMMIFSIACNSISSRFAIGFYAAALSNRLPKFPLHHTLIVLEIPSKCTLFDMRPMIHGPRRGKIPLMKSPPEQKNAEAAAARKAA
jgi:hypothetical protein